MSGRPVNSSNGTGPSGASSVTPAPGSRDRAVYLAYRASAEAMRLLPEPLAGASAHGVGLALTAFRRSARSMYAANLTRVLGERPPERELRAWTRRAFTNYARYWLEGARVPSLAPRTILDRFVVESGMHHLVENMAAGKGVILALPHVGSWEWGGAWLALNGYPMTSVAEPVEPKELYDFFASQREAMGLRIVPMDSDAVGILLRTLRDGGLVGLLCDRDVVGGGVEVEFFGETTTLPAGPALLAIRTGAAVLPTAVYSGPGRFHTAVIRPPLPVERSGSLRDDVSRVTRDIARSLEELIRRAPDQWYLFQPNWPADQARSRGTAHGNLR